MLKIKLNREILVKQIGKACKALDRSAVREGFESLKFCAENGFLHITGASAIMTVVADVPILEMEGTPQVVAVGRDILLRTLTKIPADEVTLSLLDNSKAMEIKGGRVRLKAPLLDPDKIPDRKQEKIVKKISSPDFVRHVDACSHGLGAETADARMKSFFFEFAGETMRTTTIDGYRASIRNNLAGDADTALIVPGSQILDVCRMLTDNNICIQVPESGNSIIISCDGLYVNLSLVEGSYFNVEKFRTFEPAFKLKADTQAMLDAIVLAEQIGDTVRLEYNNNQITVAAATTFGSVEADIPVTATDNAKPLVLGVKAKYLSAALKSLDSETFTIGLTSERNPILIGTSDQAVREVVMPVHLR